MVIYLFQHLYIISRFDIPNVAFFPDQAIEEI